MRDEAATLTTVRASSRRSSRLFGSIWRQRARSLICPATPRLDGKRFLVTGGSDGIGLGTSRGLSRRGAEVIIASRSSEKGDRACASLREELGAAARVSFVPLDLSDLDGVLEFAKVLSARLGGRRLDGLICNAGLWPQRHRVSPQGHELAFATNVLGHFLLLRLLLSEGGSVGRLLTDDARIVVVTGDIYVLSGDCTPDYPFRTPLGGMFAYCRSKLGNLWIAGELQRRHPQLRVRVAHPGVVATSLGGARSGFADALSRRVLLDVDRGAQTTLYCATQEGLPDAAYVHNTLGRMELDPKDPASDRRRASELWDRCEELCRVVPEAN